MIRHPNWRASIGSRVRCKGRGGKWTVMSSPSGKTETVEIQVDADPVTGPIDPETERLPCESITAALTDLEPLWPPEPGALVEVRVDGRIGKVANVFDMGAGRVVVDLQTTDATTG